MSSVGSRVSLSRFPARWSHLAEKETRQLNMPEHIPSAKPLRTLAGHVLIAAAWLLACASQTVGQEAEGLQPTITDDAQEPASPPPFALKPLPSIDDIQSEEETSAARRPAPVVDPYAPQGIDAGGLRLFPSIAVGAEYTSNVAQSPDDPQSAAGVAVKPGLRLQSDWSRHELTGNVSGDFTFFPKYSENDQRALDADANFRLDIRRTTTADFGAFYTLDQAGREDSELPDAAAERRTDQTFGVRAGLTHNLGAFDAEVRAGVAREVFGDVELNGGGVEDNSDRNLIAPTAGFRFTYSDPPVLKPFIDVAVTPRIHDDKRDRNGLKRDSLEAAAQLGVAIDNGPLWSGEVALAYLRRSYSDETLDSASAIGINGNLTWRPTDITTIVLSAGTSLEDATSAAQSASKVYTGRIDVTQAMRENIDAFAGAGFALEKGGQNAEKTFETTIGLNWQLTPEWAWTASYDTTWFKGAIPDDDYTEHRILTGIVLRR